MTASDLYISVHALVPSGEMHRFGSLQDGLFHVNISLCTLAEALTDTDYKIPQRLPVHPRGQAEQKMHGTIFMSQ